MTAAEIIAEYELFAAQRRAQKEAIGENDQFAQLEAAAKLLTGTQPKGKNKRTQDGQVDG